MWRKENGFAEQLATGWQRSWTCNLALKVLVFFHSMRRELQESILQETQYGSHDCLSVEPGRKTASLLAICQTQEEEKQTSINVANLNQLHLQIENRL